MVIMNSHGTPPVRPDHHSPTRPVRRTLTAAVALTLLTAACGSDSSSDDTSATSPMDTSDATAPSDATTAPEATASGSDPAPDGTAGGGTTDATTIEIEQSSYGTEEIAVGPGEPVVFVNNDPVDHTVTSADDSPQAFDSGTFGQDEEFEIAFDEAGSYSFFCEIHPTMRATIVVE